MKDRITQLRKALKLNQTAFGKRIGFTASGISNIENGTREVQEKHIKLILSEFPFVNEAWLRTGKGEMFLPQEESSVEALAHRLSFPEICARLLHAYDSLTPDQQEAVLAYARSFIASLAQDDADRVAAAIARPSSEEAARQALAKRMAGETSPSSKDGSTETA